MLQGHYWSFSGVLVGGYIGVTGMVQMSQKCYMVITGVLNRGARGVLQGYCRIYGGVKWLLLGVFRMLPWGYWGCYRGCCTWEFTIKNQIHPYTNHRVGLEQIINTRSCLHLLVMNPICVINFFKYLC